MTDGLFRKQGVEIKLKLEEDFLKIKETLTRIGIVSRKNNTLFQSCHILHKKDKDTNDSRYAIMHFKEMFFLDGKQSTITEEDINRRNTIVNLLEEWGLIEIVDKKKIDGSIVISSIKIIPFKDKQKWNLSSKYTVGKIRKGTIHHESI